VTLRLPLPIVLSFPPSLPPLYSFDLPDPSIPFPRTLLSLSLSLSLSTSHPSFALRTGHGNEARDVLLIGSLRLPGIRPAICMNYFVSPTSRFSGESERAGKQKSVRFIYFDDQMITASCNRARNANTDRKIR